MTKGTVTQRKKGDGGAHTSPKKAEPAQTEPQNPELKQQLLAEQPLDAKRWQSWSQRVFWSWVLVLSFMAIVCAGHLYICLLVMVLQVACFYEVVSTAFKANKALQKEETGIDDPKAKASPPFFRTLNWYFLFCANYFLYGKHIARHLHELMPGVPLFLQLSKMKGYHNFISFSLYTAGLVAFVLTLQQGSARKQFSQFGWTHVTCLIVVSCSRFMVFNLFEGLIWFLLPVFIVICNDVWAYIFGFFFGRTRLIELSPKKTWEGFTGAFFMTMIFGFVAPWIWAQSDYFICPVMTISFKPSLGALTCVHPYVFTLQQYFVPEQLHFLFGPSLQLYPVQIHGLVFAFFGSVIAPFGGFMASGFKRAFKVKDFSDLIPGHGGVMDRFDCQFLMAAFVFVYHQSFIQGGTSRISFERILELVLDMSQERKLELYNLLKDHLVREAIIPA
eukprot:comp23043_c0_seq1/m.36869 comp23043_c0_seq1/g.36869  ORF comp23043_c0_seq1/g.36869 comp23043_c0_seq1/m.36869 type:complete len:446 (-) comp23043_c0_seq1:422-1759(-)